MSFVTLIPLHHLTSSIPLFSLSPFFLLLPASLPPSLLSLPSPACSYWKDLGFLLVYLSGRPDMQKEYIMTFLATNAFPLGLVACSDTISTDSHLKTLYLARLIREVCLFVSLFTFLMSLVFECCVVLTSWSQVLPVFPRHC